MAEFTNDFAGRTRAEQIELVRAAARDEGTEITEEEATRAIALCEDLFGAEGGRLDFQQLAPWPAPPHNPGRWTPCQHQEEQR